MKLNLVKQITSFLSHIGRVIWASWPIALSFFFLGIIIPLLLRAPDCPEGWTFKKEFAIADIINILNSVVVLLLFMLFLSRAIASETNFKGLLSKMCETASEFLKSSRAIYDDRKRLSSTDATETFQELQEKCRDLADCISEIQRLWIEAEYKDLGFSAVTDGIQAYRTWVLHDDVYAQKYSIDLDNKINYYYQEMSYLIHELTMKIMLK